MPADSSDSTYYCTQCHIETTLARVCPKCHRKTTLRPRGSVPAGAAGPRRRASSAQVPAVGGARRGRWVLGGVLATAVVCGVAWWFIAQGRRRPATARDSGPAAGYTAGAMPAGSPNRVFGAPRPGARVAPPAPPRICGTAYRVRIAYTLHGLATKGAPGAGMGRRAPGPRPAPQARSVPKARPRPGAKPKPGAPRPVRRGPDVVEHQHTFLLAGRGDHRTYVPLRFEIKITVGEKHFTALQLSRQGGLLPDPRTRRPRRLGYHDHLQPGLRLSDLIGRVQADLAPDPRGGFTVTRHRLKNRLVTQWVQTGIGLANFLGPRPPKPGARLFLDQRLPPKAAVAGIEHLLRRFRRQPSKAAKDAAIHYAVDSPTLAMRRAKATTPVKGLVTLVPGELLPRQAELTVDKVPRKGGGTQTITVRLDHQGPRCNDK